MKKSKTIIMVANILIPIFSSVSFGFTIDMRSRDIFDLDTSAMDHSLSIGDYSVEDFEDSVLQSGLSMTFVGTFQGLNDNPITFSSNPPTKSMGTVSQWDGQHYLYNNPSDGHRYRTIFHLPQNVVSFGIGLSDFDKTYSIFVNGNLLIPSISSDPAFTRTYGSRNAYILIHAELDEVIDSVEFRQKYVSNAIDEVEFDHLSYKVVPEPATLFLLALGGLMLRKRK